jgi:general secretion pathway protein L
VIVNNQGQDKARLTVPLSHAFADVVDWWKSELVNFVPQRLGFWLTDAGERDVLLDHSDRKAVRLLLRDKAGVTREKTVNPGEDIEAALDDLLTKKGHSRSQVSFGIALPAEKFFLRELIIPREARRSIETIVLRDLLYHTPFREDEIYHAYSVKAAGPKLVIRQSVIRRSLVRQAISDLDISPDRLDFVHANGLAEGYPDKLSLKPQSQKSQPVIKLLAGLAISGLLLGSAVLALEHERQRSTLEALEQDVAAAQARALKVRSALDAENETTAALGDLRERKRVGPSLLQVWEELSRILPDDSWVQELRLAQQGQNGHELTITGFSTAAASLVEVLDRSTLLANVALTAPISLDPIEKRERFVLKARIENAVAKGAP